MLLENTIENKKLFCKGFQHKYHNWKRIKGVEGNQQNAEDSGK